MDKSYTETRDARGRTTIALKDNQAAVMLVCAAMGVVPLFIFGWDATYLVLAELLVFGSLAAWFRFAGPAMAVTIDPRARTLTVAAARKPRVLAYGEVVRAQLNSVFLASTPGHPGGERRQAHRVDLVLRSGEVLPLMSGYGLLNVEDCHRLVSRLNDAFSAQV